jgi:hypothetical protein
LALVIGLLAGLAGGLYYAWFLNPVQFINVSPRQLNVEDQEEFIQLVAEAYLQDGDLDRAQARLAGLGLRDVVENLTTQADAVYLRGGDPSEIRALTTLAEALGGQPLAAELFSGTVAPTNAVTVTTPTPSPTGEQGNLFTPSVTPESITATPTFALPTATPDVFANTEFGLIEQETACVEGEGAGYIEVYVTDEEGNGIPAVEVLVEWADDQDTFFTGLKPGIDLGYGDFLMEADEVYSITLVGLGEPVLGLDSAGCRAPTGRTSIPTYRLTFAPAETVGG